MPRLKTDLVYLLVQTNNGTLGLAAVEIDERAAATVMAVSGGYPGTYAKGKPITLPEMAEPSVLIFHAGTGIDHMSGALVTNGGRVITATAFGHTIQEAAHKATQAVESIHFDGKYFRPDIGYEFH
jgi:phosphoribosylamine--glycine ligase